jgi:hypothetical protein
LRSISIVFLSFPFLSFRDRSRYAFFSLLFALQSFVYRCAIVRQYLAVTLQSFWIKLLTHSLVHSRSIKELESKFIDNLFVTRVVDAEIMNEDSQINDKVQGAITPYEPGRVALFMGTKQVQQKSLDLLERMGYPRETVVSLII